jgi:hypothetical protein
MSEDRELLASYMHDAFCAIERFSSFVDEKVARNREFDLSTEEYWKIQDLMTIANYLVYAFSENE